MILFDKTVESAYHSPTQMGEFFNMRWNHIHTPLIATLLFLLLVGCGQAAGPEATARPLTEEEQAGQAVYTRHCAACHLLTPDDVKVGPSLYGIADQAGSRVEGEDVNTYLLNSIMNPGDYLVDGFDNVMPQDLAKKLTGEQIDAVVAYLLTLEVKE